MIVSLTEKQKKIVRFVLTEKLEELDDLIEKVNPSDVKSIKEEIEALEQALKLVSGEVK